jgi:hypothetical protein
MESTKTLPTKSPVQTARSKRARKGKTVRRDKKGRRIYTFDDFKKMDEFILPREPEWEAEWERRTGLKAQP